MDASQPGRTREVEVPHATAPRYQQEEVGGTRKVPRASVHPRTPPAVVQDFPRPTPPQNQKTALQKTRLETIPSELIDEKHSRRHQRYRKRTTPSPTFPETRHLEACVAGRKSGSRSDPHHSGPPGANAEPEKSSSVTLRVLYIRNTYANPAVSRLYTVQPMELATEVVPTRARVLFWTDGVARVALLALMGVLVGILFLDYGLSAKVVRFPAALSFSFCSHHDP